MREADPERLEGEREHHRVEVAVREHRVLLHRGERVVVDRVQLELDRLPRGGDLFPQGAVHLGDDPEGERVLNRERGVGILQVAPG